MTAIKGGIWVSEFINLMRTLPVMARKIKKVTGTVNIYDWAILPDKIIISGALSWQLYYIGDDDLTHFASGEIPFSTFIHITGASEGMNARLSGEIESIDAVILKGGSKINIKAVIRITASIEDKSQVSPAPGGTTDIIAEIILNETSLQTMAEEVLSLGRNAIKIVAEDVTPFLESVEVIEGKVLLQGRLSVGISYVGEDNLSYYKSFEIASSGFVEIPEAMPGMKACVTPILESSQAVLLSPNQILFKAVIRWDIRLLDTSIAQITPVPTGDEYRILFLVGSEVALQHIVTAQTPLERQALKVREIRNRVTELDADVVPDKVLISGILSKEIYYVGTDGINYSQAVNYRFSTFVDYPGALPGHEAFVEVQIEYEHFELVDSLLQDKTLLRLLVRVAEPGITPIELGAGQELLLPRVVGQNSVQLMLSKAKSVKEQITVTKALIVLTTQTFGSSQTQIIRRSNAIPPAVSIIDSHVEVENVTAVPLENFVEVSGEVVSTISYMGTDNKTHNIENRGTFSTLIPVPGTLPTDSVSVSSEAKFYDIDIIFSGSKILEIIDIKTKVTVSRQEIQEVVTNVTGPHITVERVLVRVQIPSGETIEMYVVTDVTGPKISAVKKSMVLDVVGEGQKLLDVVVDVIILALNKTAKKSYKLK